MTTTYFQKLGKAIMVPMAVLPAAVVMLRLGAPDMLDWPWLFVVGKLILLNIPIVFAVGIAVSIAKGNNGMAGLAAVIGYFALTSVVASFDRNIHLGILAGFFSGIAAGYMYNKFYDFQLPDVLGFLGGTRFVPIITVGSMLIAGVILGYIWPSCQQAFDALKSVASLSDSVYAMIFGMINRALLPIGLHHIINFLVWFQLGTYTTEGQVVTGDLVRFFSQDPSSGIFMTGFFPIMMFGLPAACLAMITAAKPAKRKQTASILLGSALTSFLTGISEPIEFAILALSPVLFAVHVVFTGLSMFVTTSLGIKCGFSFSAGAIDWILSYGIAAKPGQLLAVGIVFAVLYYVVFLIVIKCFKLGLKESDEVIDHNVGVAGLNQDNLVASAEAFLGALGGRENIVTIDACITRLRLTVKEVTIVDEKQLKLLGAISFVKVNNTTCQVVVGTIADRLATHIRKIMNSL
ncbi:MAG: sugar transporter [Firmicutes bacterium]|nr:sugar transporter [Bacillota bacterium]